MKSSDFRVLCLIGLLVMLSGCGVEWFPEFKKSPTNPNAFSFATRLGVPILTPYSSAAVTITGFANNSTASPISVSDGSKYSINGAAATSAAGTIKNNDSVKLFQTTASVPGTQSVSTLTVGSVPGTFTTVTQTIATPTFGPPITPSINAAFIEIASGVISGVDSGGHTITMTGFGTEFAVADSALNVFAVSPTTSTQPVSVSFLNNQRIILLIPVTNAAATTTLTIDNTNFVISNVTPFTVTSSPK